MKGEDILSRHSDVAAIQAQIERECQVLFHLSQFSHISPHQYIAARYKALDGSFHQLEKIIGIEQALDIVYTTYSQALNQEEVI